MLYSGEEFVYFGFMLAVRKVAHGIGNIELQDVPEPQAGAGEVVIEVNSAGICGTDLHIYLGEFETTPPVTMGHELAGTIVELGREVDGWSVGDRVTTETYFSTCGHCVDCRRGRRNLCLQPLLDLSGSERTSDRRRHLSITPKCLSEREVVR